MVTSSLLGSRNVRDQYLVGRSIPSVSFCSERQPTWRSHVLVSNVNCPFLLGSVRTGGEINFSLEASSALSYFSLRPSSSFPSVFLIFSEMVDAVRANLVINRLKTLQSLNDERSSVTIVSVLSSRITSADWLATSRGQFWWYNPNSLCIYRRGHTSRFSAIRRLFWAIPKQLLDGLYVLVIYLKR